MMRYEFTNHARYDRLERLTACVEAVGLGEILKQTVNTERKTITQITSTGLILIKGLETNRLVTGYMATVSQVAYLYHGHTPTSLMKIVKKNNKQYSHLLEMQIKIK